MDSSSSPSDVDVSVELNSTPVEKKPPNPADLNQNDATTTPLPSENAKCETPTIDNNETEKDSPVEEDKIEETVLELKNETPPTNLDEEKISANEDVEEDTVKTEFKAKVEDEDQDSAEPNPELPANNESDSSCVYHSAIGESDDVIEIQDSISDSQTSEIVVVDRKCSFPPTATTAEETWDFSLRTKDETSDEGSSSKAGTIWLADTEFQRKLEDYGTFDTCEHEVIKIQCPCDNKIPFSICSKCHRVFCNNKCLKKSKEKKGQITATTNADDQENSSSTIATGPSSPPRPVVATESIKQLKRGSPGRQHQQQHPPAQRKRGMGNKYNHEAFMASPLGLQYDPLSATTNLMQLQQASWVVNQSLAAHMMNNNNGSGGLMGPWPMVHPIQSQVVGFPHHPQLGGMQQQSMPIMMNQQQPPNNNYPSFRNPPPPSTTTTAPPEPDRVNRDPGFPTTLAPLPPSPYDNNNVPTLVSSTRRSFNNTRNRSSILSAVTGDWGDEQTAAPPHHSYDGTGPPTPFLNNLLLDASSSQNNETAIADVNQLQKFRGVGRGSQPQNIISSSPVNSAGSSSPISSNIGAKPVPLMSSYNNESDRSRRPLPLNPQQQQRPAEVIPRNKPSPAFDQPADPYSVKSSRSSGLFSYSNGQNNTQRTPAPTPAFNKWNKYPNGAPVPTTTSTSSKPMNERQTEADIVSQTNRKSLPPSKFRDGDNRNMAPPHIISREPGTSTKAASPSSSGPSPFKVKAQMETGLQNLRTGAKNIVSNDPVLCDPYIFYGVPMQVTYTYGDSLFDFHVATSIGRNANDAINEELLTVEELPPPVAFSPVVGEYCIAKYISKEDGIDDWFRARITRVIAPDNLFEVFFFDYGNSTEVTKSLIRPLPNSLRQMRPSAIRITIGDFQPTVPIEDLRTVFDDFVIEKKFRITIFENPTNSSSSSFSNYPLLYKAKIEIKHDEQWIEMATILENDGYGRKVSFGTKIFKQSENKCDDYPALNATHKEITVKISHFNHPNDFYVIPETCLADREVIMERLNASDSSHGAYTMKEWLATNYVCIAKRSDGKWARAKISEITNKCTAVVRFCDFGETVETQLNDLKSIPTNLLAKPQFAYRCSLPIFPSRGKWDLTDPNVTILDEMKKAEISVVIVMFALEFDIPAHIVEVFQEEKFGGLSKSLLKKNKDSCVLEYEVDLDIRKKIQKSRAEQYLLKQSTTTPPITTGRHDLRNNDAKPSTSSVHEFFTLKNLEASKPLKFFSKSEFKIIFLQGFNELFIRPTEFIELEMRLQDQIIECVDSTETFNEALPPPLNSIVIAPYKDGNFHRAVVKNIKNSKARVEFIDVGDSLKVPVQQLTPASVKVLQFPKLVYWAKLKDIDDDPKLLLRNDFMEEMGKLIKMTHLMDTCNGMQEPYIVNLRPLGAPSTDNISKRILKKQVWEWESLLNDTGCRTDTALLSKSKYRVHNPPKFDLVTNTVLPKGIKLNGEVSQILSDGDVCIVNVQEHMIRREHVVLQNQITRFVSKVNSTNFYPVIEEIMLIYLPDIPQLQRLELHGIGKWNRCIREASDRFRNIDYDEIYPMAAEACQHFQFRRLSPEFLLRVPAGIIECTLKDYKPSVLMNERMKEELGNRKSVRFTVEDFNKDNMIHIISIDSLPPV